ncbi:hypothetical protein JXJ21_17180 [candidate division KSB1 bacterium]|nr:hypothetical protein [candidate division KSB1 bacterium]
MIASCIVALTILVSNQISAFDFSVSPPIIRLKLHPNSAKQISLDIHNRNLKELSLIAEVMALELTQTGEAQPAQKSEWSCADWITLSQRQIRLLPGENRKLSVTITVPANIAGGRYATILFRTETPQNTENHVKLIGQMGTIIMIESFGAKNVSGLIEGFAYQKDGKAIRFGATIRNNGNIHFKADGSIVIMDEQNRIVDRLNLESGTGTVLPGGVRRFEATWSNPRKMLPGKYQAKLNLRIPGGRGILQDVQIFTL